MEIKKEKLEFYKELNKLKRLEKRFEQKLIDNQFRNTRDKKLGNLWAKLVESKSGRNLVFYVELAGYKESKNGVLELTVSDYSGDILEQVLFSYDFKGINSLLKSLDYWLNDKDLTEGKK